MLNVYAHLVGHQSNVLPQFFERLKGQDPLDEMVRDLAFVVKHGGSVRPDVHISFPRKEKSFWGGALNRGAPPIRAKT